MKMYTPEDVQNLPEFKRALMNVQSEIQRLEKEKHFFEKRISDLQQITEFYEGIPLNITKLTDSFDIIAVVPGNLRRSSIYHNAHVPNDVDRWGIDIYDFGESDPFKRTRWLGSHHTKENVLKIGKEWVVNGMIPEGI